jgi:hypothetical protein
MPTSRPTQTLKSNLAPKGLVERQCTRVVDGSRCVRMRKVAMSWCNECLNEASRIRRRRQTERKSGES